MLLIPSVILGTSHWWVRQKSKSKLQNDTTEGPVQGHIFSVSKNQMDLFEKVSLMPSMKYGYRFEKYDINDLKEKEKQEMLEVLKQEDQ